MYICIHIFVWCNYPYKTSLRLVLFTNPDMLTHHRPSNLILLQKQLIAAARNCTHIFMLACLVPPKTWRWTGKASIKFKCYQEEIIQPRELSAELPGGWSTKIRRGEGTRRSGSSSCRRWLTLNGACFMGPRGCRGCRRGKYVEHFAVCVAKVICQDVCTRERSLRCSFRQLTSWYRQVKSGS